MKKLTLCAGLLLPVLVNQAFAGGGRASGDLMSHFLATQPEAQAAPKSGLERGFHSSGGKSKAPQGEMSTDLTLEQCQTSDLNPQGAALVFNDKARLASRFPYDKTMNAIINSSGAGGSATSVTQTMLDSLTATEQTNPLNPQLRMPVDVRPNEAAVSAATLAGGAFEPVALFNRFDLTDAQGAHCGEYRIVYGANGGFSNRFLVIFEALYPNPEPAKGLDGCLAVADFWTTLDDTSMSADAKADLLEQFYFTGLTHNGVTLPPVVTFQNYSASGGQVRTNQFSESPNKWQLREFRTATAGGNVVLSVDTVKSNPLAELYNTGSSLAGAPGADQTNIDKFVNLRTDFQNTFIAEYLSNLTAPENSGLTDANDIINGFSLSNHGRFDEFQSDAQGSQDFPNADQNFRDLIEPIAISAGLNVNQVINRAAAMTCGGCHQLSNGASIAPNVTWPSSAFFVHVTESGSLSQALTQSFLPQRAALLEAFVCDRIPPPEPPQPQDLAWLVPVMHLILF